MDTLTSDKTRLSHLEKDDKENMREYAKKQRDFSTQVHPSLLYQKMVTLFANTFKAIYCDHMMSNLTHQFTNVVTMAKCIEQGIRMIKFLCPLRKKRLSKEEKGC